MPNQQISLNQGKMMISGELTFSSARSLWEASQKIFPQQAEWNCDFSQVSNCDSAGLGLLFEWIKLAKQQGKKLRFSQVPQQLLSIAKPAGLDRLLKEYM